MNAKQTQRDLLAILDRMSLSIEGTRTELGGAISVLLDSHVALAESVIASQGRLEAVEKVVLQLVKVAESQSVLITLLLEKDNG